MPDLIHFRRWRRHSPILDILFPSGSNGGRFLLGSDNVFQDATTLALADGDNVLSSIGQVEATFADHMSVQTELVVNGTFDADLSSWDTLGAAAVWDAGEASFSATAGQLRQTSILSGAGFYSVSYEKTVAGNGRLSIGADNGSALVPGNYETPVAVYDYLFHGLSTSTAVWYHSYAAAKVDNFSAKKVDALVLDQSDLGKQPSLKVSGGANYLLHDGVTETMEFGSGLNVTTGSWWITMPVYLVQNTTAQCLIGKGSNASADNIRCFVNSSGQLQVFWGSDAQNYPASTGTTTTGQVQILTFGVDAGTNEVFYAIDGVEERKSITISGTGTNSLPWSTGRDSAALNGSNMWLGSEWAIRDIMPDASNRLGYDQRLAAEHGVTLA